MNWHRGANLAEALVKDMDSHLFTLQETRSVLEAAVACAEMPEVMAVVMQDALTCIASYQTAAAHVAKHVVWLPKCQTKQLYGSMFQ